MSFFVNGGVSNCHYYISSFSGLAACRNGARRSSWMPLREGWSSKGRKNVKNRRPRRSKVLQAVCMDKSTFLRSLIPKEEIGAYRFLQEHPCYDGRGVVIAILDSGIDPSAAGLQVTSDGKPKIVDIIDCTGSCNVDTSKVVKADVDGLITGASGRCLLVNKEWKNPSGEWRIGYKFVYQLFPQASTARLKRKRREKWEKDHRKAFLQAIENLKSFDEKHPQLHIKDLQRDRKDLQSRICFLQKQEEAYYDKGPIIDVVVWNDGDVWRVAFDTQDLEEDRKNGKLANFIPLTNYRLERKYAVFSQLDACTFTVNIYNEGNCLSLITDDSSHGTHVSGIAAAYHPEAPLLNGIAPGAQLIVCKIGDTRLGSRKTGKSLIRALIAAVRNRCDIISMSCGGLPMLPNYGHLTRFIHEVVNKHGIIFVSSVGNEGPSLSTLIAPGGCSTGVIGVGAYLSPNIAAAGHCLVEPNIKGLEYTSSSRGPAVDGDIGVCLSAPGGAVASVPTWMLQRRKLKNGTSMATPCACGGVALLLSFMKAEGLCINPFIIRKALEETTVQIGDEPEDILSTGEGLMQVDKAYKFLKKCAKPGLTCYEVEVERTGNPGPIMRGIYLREPCDSVGASKWMVQVKPKKHGGNVYVEALCLPEKCIQLRCSDSRIVTVPEYLHLTQNQTNFNILVDPTPLKEGLHYFDVQGISSNGFCTRIFRVPIIIVKPLLLKGNPHVQLFTGISFHPGQIERKFVEVPIGASWVEMTMSVSGFDTPRSFPVSFSQINPKSHPDVWKTTLSFPSPSVKRFVLYVQEGRTLEVTIAQSWSSGIGSHATTVVDLKAEFHGIIPDKKEILLSGTENSTKIDLKSLLSYENLVPIAYLYKIRVPYPPVDSKMVPLQSNIDKSPFGDQIFKLTIIYKFELDKGWSITPFIPLLSGRIFDTEFESQFYTIRNSNKHVVAMGNAFPKTVRLSKGVYTLDLIIRHENIRYLEKLKNLILFLDKHIERKNYLKLKFYTQPDGCITGACACRSTTLIQGKTQSIYVCPPLESKLPKDTLPGSVMIGKITYGTSCKGTENTKTCPASYKICYVMPPPKVQEKKAMERENKRNRGLKQHWEQEVLNAKIRVLKKLSRGSIEDCQEWAEFASSLELEYPNNPWLLAQILYQLVTLEDKTEPLKHKKAVIRIANMVIASIDKQELVEYFGIKNHLEDENPIETKRKMNELRQILTDALFAKGLELSSIEQIKGKETKENEQKDLFEENYIELCKWADLQSSIYILLTVLHERRSGHPGSAIQALENVIGEGYRPTRTMGVLWNDLIKECGWDYLASYGQHRLFPSLPKDYHTS